MNEVCISIQNKALEAKPLIYLAVPYTDKRIPEKDRVPGDLTALEERRFKQVTVVSGRLAQSGIANFSPITQSHEQNRMVKMGGTWEDWKAIDEVFLAKADEIWILAIPGWSVSSGVTAEIQFMKDAGRPVKYINPLVVEDQHNEYFITEAEARMVV